MSEELPILTSAILLALIPFFFILMTSFTRISIILTFLRQALSTSVPSSQIIIGLSLILTGYIMHPVLKEVYDSAIHPYLEHKIEKKEEVFEKAWPPLRDFMLLHTREKDLLLFLEMGNVQIKEPVDIKQIPWFCVIPSFVLSELRTAFMLGFFLFLPFLVIDMVVSSILMSMGMVMLPPVLISFPFKILLFIVVDGWRLVVQQVVAGYQ